MHGSLRLSAPYIYPHTKERPLVPRVCLLAVRLGEGGREVRFGLSTQHSTRAAAHCVRVCERTRMDMRACAHLDPRMASIEGTRVGLRQPHAPRSPRASARVSVFVCLSVAHPTAALGSLALGAAAAPQGSTPVRTRRAPTLAATASPSVRAAPRRAACRSSAHSAIAAAPTVSQSGPSSSAPRPPPHARPLASHSRCTHARALWLCVSLKRCGEPPPAHSARAVRVL